MGNNLNTTYIAAFRDNTYTLVEGFTDLGALVAVNKLSHVFHPKVMMALAKQYDAKTIIELYNSSCLYRQKITMFGKVDNIIFSDDRYVTKEEEDG